MPAPPTGVGINAYNLKGQGILILYPERLFDGSGEVTRWYQKKAVELRGNLIHYAPWRTGRLRRSIRVQEQRTGPLQRTISVRFGVRYAAYTDKGTKPVITAGGKKMPVGRSQGASGLYYRSPTGQKIGPGYTYRTSVRGQRGTNWVRRSVRDIPVFSRYSG